MPWVALQCAIEVFPDYTQSLFNICRDVVYIQCEQQRNKKCGATDRTGAKSGFNPFTTTRCCLEHMKESIHINYFLPVSYTLEPRTGKSEGGDIISPSWFECILNSSTLPNDGLSELLFNFYWHDGLLIPCIWVPY